MLIFLFSASIKVRKAFKPVPKPISKILISVLDFGFFGNKESLLYVTEMHPEKKKSKPCLI